MESDSPRITIVLPTFNRLGYTQQSIPRLLEDSSEKFELVIWDNASTDGTRDYLRSLRDDRIAEIILRDENEGAAAAVNQVWGHSDAELCGKLDNDCLVTPGWTRILSRAHREVPELGGVGCWHFMPEDFDLELARHKLRRFGSHQIVAHPHIGGSAFLTKRADFEQFGPIDPTWLQPEYWRKLAAHGRVNGWYYPLIHQEHMDDPRSPRCLLPERFDAADAPYTVRIRGWRTRADFESWIRADARSILTSSSELRDHTGWRKLRRQLRARIARKTRLLYRRLTGT